MPPMVAYYHASFGVDGLMERIAELEKENVRLVAEVERLRALASRPVSWASPAGPCSVSVIGRFAAPGGAGPGADGEEAAP